jgi:hypothetical protein
VPQMLREPVGGGGCSAQELVGVGREVAAGVELQPLRLASAGERSQGEVGGADDVGVANHHEERVGAMRSMNAPGSYSEYISSDRSVISLRHFLNRHLSSSGAFLPVKKSHASMAFIFAGKLEFV